MAAWSRAVSTTSPPPSALPSGCAHFPPSITDTEGGHVVWGGTVGPPVPAPSVRGGPWGMNINPTEEPRDSASQGLLLPCMCQQGSVVDLDPTPRSSAFARRASAEPGSRLNIHIYLVLRRDFNRKIACFKTKQNHLMGFRIS